MGVLDRIEKLQKKEMEFWSIVKRKDCSRKMKKDCLTVISKIQNKIEKLRTDNANHDPYRKELNHLNK
mgnify:CR=1 FL=1